MICDEREGETSSKKNRFVDENYHLFASITRSNLTIMLRRNFTITLVEINKVNFNETEIFEGFESLIIIVTSHSSNELISHPPASSL